ncbi:flavin-containing amine oxidoreductase-domain containing protein [Zychaea mexicana]|uniref:flavin-containing amine oxidoreductase-domain containing protein n=1 Tax=Zychaea mexicana TaxID=64656 RepID=UPI0022FED0A6|nr:flavin-containing amine oxidoreductase-domain containing protein [Zychaea mexicana]KAI9495649.1 flavin-containing amine oxidoreductase-domain containing protein [Zychaea mexicana]
MILSMLVTPLLLLVTWYYCIPITLAAAISNDNHNDFDESSSSLSPPGTLHVLDDTLEAGSLTNIYLDYGAYKLIEPEGQKMTLSFGVCDITSEKFHRRFIIGTTEVSPSYRPSKFTWAIPTISSPLSQAQQEQEGCIHATITKRLHRQQEDDGLKTKVTLVASSRPYRIRPKRLVKRGFSEQEFFDAFKYFKEHAAKVHNDDTTHFIAADGKNKKIGIIGAGISGLFSGYLLDQAGFHDYEILEASDRMGGRIQTVYFNQEHTAYQEMGSMRVPVQWTYNGTTLPITDHDILFQAVEELNNQNADNPDLKVDFIPWIQTMSNNLVYRNGIRMPDGNIPTVNDAVTNPLFWSGDPVDLAEQVSNATQELLEDHWKVSMSQNLHAAHKEALEEGYDDWSLWGWLHNKMGVTLNATDYALGSFGNVDIWNYMYHTFLGSATEWRTVQGGMSRITNAFVPFVGHKVTYNVKVTKIDYEEDDDNNRMLSVQWKDTPTLDAVYHKKLYDKVIMSVPFSIARMMHLPKELPYTLRRAIDNLGYGQACKVALEFKSRFWEKYEKPILGGCDITDLKSEMVCYPSNNLGSGGPGVMLASYSTDQGGLRFASMTEQQHITRVLEDIMELHGEEIVKEQYTGNYHRKCWILDEFQSGAWAQPTPGQAKLFLPAYFQHANGIVVIGEQTDIKHAWISGALESAIRGVTMILIESGHVDEAKKLVKKWNAGWMDI